MKIPASISAVYRSQHELNLLLQSKVELILKDICLERRSWQYLLRLKEPESFAQKLETGRVPRPAALEDFLGATLIVENRSEIAEARKIVDRHFSVKYRRPKTDTETTKAPDAFPFDDLRLYVRLRRPREGEAEPIQAVIFEIQIRTLLQHAWTVATHKLVYKGGTVSWSRSRVAHQVKAMLEQAEMALEAIDRLESPMTDLNTRARSSAVGLLSKVWPEERLPADRIRLADAILELTSQLGLTTSEVEAALTSPHADGIAKDILNLTPYGAFVVAVARFHPERLRAFVAEPNTYRARLFITKEMEDEAELLKELQSERVVRI